MRVSRARLMTFFRLCHRLEGVITPHRISHVKRMHLFDSLWSLTSNRINAAYQVINGTDIVNKAFESLKEMGVKEAMDKYYQLKEIEKFLRSIGVKTDAIRKLKPIFSKFERTKGDIRKISTVYTDIDKIQFKFNGMTMVRVLACLVSSSAMSSPTCLLDFVEIEDI